MLFKAFSHDSMQRGCVATFPFLFSLNGTAEEVDELEACSVCGVSFLGGG